MKETITNDERVYITNKVINEYEEKYKDFFQDKRSKKNKRTKEGLFSAINKGVEYISIDSYNDKIITKEIYEEILRKNIERSVFFYINEPLIWRIVRKFDNLSISEEDRYSAAVKGFVIAQNTYNPEMGNTFSTLAWRIISNEIIAENKKYLKEKVIKRPDHKIISRDNGIVTDIIQVFDGKKIKRDNEYLNLYKIIVNENNNPDYPHEYNYLYDIPQDIKVGKKIKTGDFLGYTSGVEIDIGSMDSYLDDDEHGDLMFENPIKKTNQKYEQPDSIVMRDTILKKLSNFIEELEPLHKYVLFERLLPIKPKSRLYVAKELGVTDSKLAKLEDDVKLILKNRMESEGIDIKDLSIF